MPRAPSHQFTVEESTPPVLVAALRHWLPDRSWSRLRNLIRTRRVQVADTLCVDESRKLKVGQRVDVFSESLPQPPKAEAVELHYVDRDLVVVDKPSQMVTLRHKKERPWLQSKKQRQPALEEVIPDLIYSSERKHQPRVLAVHRIDRGTSGLLVFARSDHVQKQLVDQFAKHDVVRVYRAIVWGTPAQCTIRCRLVRDRGDGLRGSAVKPHAGKESVTHIRPLRSFQSGEAETYSEIECQLETGRTHQIRIHLAELGHPVCGDVVYRGRLNQSKIADSSGARRLALHATQLGFTHPTSGEPLHFTSPWPKEMLRFLESLGATDAPLPAQSTKGTKRG